MYNQGYALLNSKGKKRTTVHYINQRSMWAVRHGSTLNDSLSDPIRKLIKLREWSNENKERTINRNLYRDFILNPVMYQVAYEKIKSKPGNMSPGVDSETLDGISLEWLSETISQLRFGTFKFRKGRRVNIPKSSGKGTRPLTIGSPRDKVIQEVVRMVLDAIYDPIFLENSHGYRTGRGQHSAIRFLQNEVRTPDFCIEGDISKCFDCIDHKIIMRILSNKILDKRFLDLILKIIKAGYVEFSVPKNSLSGAPQGSIISPFLSNIYLHELDKYLLTLKNNFEMGKRKRSNPEYRHLDYLIRIEKDNVNKRKFLIQKFSLPSKLEDDPKFKRL